MVERATATWHAQITTTPTAFTICPAGCTQGWIVVDDGYDRCETCGGRWLIPAQEAQQEADTP